MMGILGTPSSDDLQSVVDACLPALQKLLIFSVGLNDDRRKVLHPLIELVAALKEMGATLETEDLFFKLGAYRLVSSNAPREDI
jgi:hypothetical protein